MKCPICNKEIGSFEEILIHLRSSHFLEYQDYIENKLLQNTKPEPTCFSCGGEKMPLTWLERDFYYLPCRSCLKRKSDIRDSRDEIIKEIKAYYKKIIGDRHFQLFILDDIYMHTTLPHDYETFSKVLRQIELPKDRDDLWFLDWKPGYPKILCTENIDGIELVSLTKYFKKFINEDYKIIVGDYEIQFPERIPYESKHYSRYNLLNKSSDARRSKRLKLSTWTVDENNCIKFFSTGEDWNNIFKLYKSGNPVDLNTLSHLDSLIIKLAILRNKTCLRLIYEVVYELLKEVSIFKDGLFLKNSILLDPGKDISFNLSWFPDNSKLNKKTINISVL